MKTMSQLTGFKWSHDRAFVSLKEYAKEDHYGSTDLREFLKSGTVQDLSNRRDALLPYLACSVSIDDLYVALGA